MHELSKKKKKLAGDYVHGSSSTFYSWLHFTPNTILHSYKPPIPNLNIKFTTVVKRWIKHDMPQRVAYCPPQDSSNTPTDIIRHASTFLNYLAFLASSYRFHSISGESDIQFKYSVHQTQCFWSKAGKVATQLNGLQRHYIHSFYSNQLMHSF